MTVRPRGRKRTLSKHVSSFNMFMDQVYQVRAIMEATGMNDVAYWTQGKRRSLTPEERLEINRRFP